MHIFLTLFTSITTIDKKKTVSQQALTHLTCYLPLSFLFTECNKEQDCPRGSIWTSSVCACVPQKVLAEEGVLPAVLRRKSCDAEQSITPTSSANIFCFCAIINGNLSIVGDVHTEQLACLSHVTKISGEGII